MAEYAMREAAISALFVSTAVLVLWLIAASVAVERLHRRGAPVGRGASVFLALLGSRPGMRALLYLLWGKFQVDGCASSIVAQARTWGRFIAPSWFVITGAVSLMWLSGALQ